MEKYEEVAAQSLEFIKGQMNVNKYTLEPKMAEQYTEDHTGRVFGSVAMPPDAQVIYPSYIRCSQFYDETYQGVCSGTHHNVGAARTNLGVEVSTYSDQQYVSDVCFLHDDGTWRTETYYKVHEIYGINGEPSRWETYWKIEDDKVNSSGSNAIKGYTLKYYRWVDKGGTTLDMDNLPVRTVEGTVIAGQTLMTTTKEKFKPVLIDDEKIEDAIPYYPDYMADFFILADVEYLVTSAPLLYDETVTAEDMPVSPPALAPEPLPYIRDVIFSPSMGTNQLEVAWVANFFNTCTINVNGTVYSVEAQQLASGYRSFKAIVKVSRGSKINYTVSGKGVAISGSLDYPVSNVYRICGDPQLTDEQSAQNWYKSQRVPSPFGKLPTLILSMGDQIDSIVDPKLKRKQYSMFAHEPVAPIMVVRGNHDRNETYFAQYSMPNDNKVDGDYFFKHENILFVVLDTNSNDYAKHMAFIDKCLAENTYTTSILVMHHSFYTVGENAYASNLIEQRKAMADFVQSKDFNVVLSGHDHIFCRNWKGKKLYMVAPSSSGSKYYKLENTGAPWAEVYQELKVPCVIDMEVTATALNFIMIDYNGTELDRVTVPK